jgi:sortase A
MRARRSRRFFGYLLMSGGALLLYFGGRELVESHLGQSEAAHEFETESPVKPSPFDGNPSAPHAPPRATPQPPPAPEVGEAIARLTIPRLQTDLYVIEGDGARQLRRGPGHVQGTALPGGDGNCIIAGHRDTHFRVLKDIRPGDEIKLRTREGEYTYRVESTQVVSPQNTRALGPTTDAELHLVTCYPFYYLGSAPKRFIVQAQLETSPIVAAAEPANPAPIRAAVAKKWRVKPVFPAAHLRRPGRGRAGFVK